jgi:hypothetical protein
MPPCPSTQVQFRRQCGGKSTNSLNEFERALTYAASVTISVYRFYKFALRLFDTDFRDARSGRDAADTIAAPMGKNLRCRHVGYWH